MSTITISKPKHIQLDDTSFQKILQDYISDLNTLDLQLIASYHRKKNIPLDELLDI